MRIDCKTKLLVNEQTVATRLENIGHITVEKLLNLINTKELNCSLLMVEEDVEKKAEVLLPKVLETAKKLFPLQSKDVRPIRKKGRKLNKELKLSNTKINILRAHHLTPKQLKTWANVYKISYSAAKRLRHANHQDIAWQR